MTHSNTIADITLHDLNSVDRLVALLTIAPPAIIFLGFSREDIEALRIDHALAYLNALSDSMLAVHGYADRAFLAISGYDDDPRDIREIPECKAFFRALVPKWGGWLHFLEKQGRSIPNLIEILVDIILVDIKVERLSTGATALHIPNLDQFDEAVPGLLRGLTEMYEHHAMAEPALKKTSLDAMAAVKRAFAPPESPGHV